MDARVYSGQWVANRMHGYGVFHWPDGRTYKGQYDHVSWEYDLSTFHSRTTPQDKKEGYGEFYWNNGRAYKGQWKDGKQNGLGIFQHPSGEERKGVWRDGSRIKWFSSEEEAETFRKVSIRVGVVGLIVNDCLSFFRRRMLLSRSPPLTSRSG